MGVLSWLEAQAVGEVVRDYGEVSREGGALYRITTTLQLRRHRRGLALVWKTKGVAFFGFSVRYQEVPIDAAAIALLRQVVADLESLAPVEPVTRT